MTDYTLDPVPFPIALLVEGLLPWLVLACGDNSFGMMLLGPSGDVRVAIPLIAGQLGWPERHAPTPPQQHPSQQRLKDRRFVLLAGSDVDAQDDAAVSDQQMHFGAEAAPRT